MVGDDQKPKASVSTYTQPAIQNLDDPFITKLSAWHLTLELSQNHRRPNDGSLFAMHAYETARIICHMGKVQDRPTISACLLHGIVNYLTSEESMRDEADNETMVLVQELARAPWPSHDQSKKLPLENLEELSPEAKLILLADCTQAIKTIPRTWDHNERFTYKAQSVVVARQCFQESEAIAEEYKRRLKLII